MRLYAGSSSQFITDTIQNQIAEKLSSAFFEYYRFNPSPNEKRSWQNSLRALKDIFQLAELHDHGVILEYQLPITSKRLDCIICGKDDEKKENAVIIELKQWEKCQESDGENEIATFIGGSIQDKLHPSIQVRQYKYYLQDTHTAFYEGTNPIHLEACCYLHNYNYYSEDVLFAKKFDDVLLNCPVFTADDTIKFKDYLGEQLRRGDGLEILQRIEKSRYRPSKKLMDHVGNVIRGNSNYVLLDEQKVVYDKVWAITKQGFHDKQKTVLIVKGGPGTGKSVIALNLMADLLLKGYNAHYATGSKAFTSTLWEIVGNRAAIQFRYFNSYVDAKPNEIDVLICDEAHRIRVTSNSRFTRKEQRSNLPQVEEILLAGKVCVFFIDDDQIVRPNEIGSVEYLRTAARNKNCRIFEYELEAQFRCNGSDAFVNWINNTLEIKKTANVLWNQKEEFDFKIFESALELEEAIKEKQDDKFSARMTAGFCWKWSDPESDGSLVNDVGIGAFIRPWNAKPKDQRKINKSVRLKNGFPEAQLWAYDPKGIDQIGCIYTAQGFEFDYVGVIIGKDLRYDLDHQKWIGYPEESYDSVVKKSGNQFLDLIKNSYRVLLSRGMKGCYVYFQDKNTERFFKSRIEK